MKYVKMLGLAAVAATALMAFVGASTASATVLCKTKVNAEGKCAAGWAMTAGEQMHAIQHEELVLTSTFKNVTCLESTVSGEITNPGGASATVSGPIKALTFTNNCNCTVIVAQEHTGTLEIHAIGDTGNGTLTSDGSTVTVSCSTIFGTVHCNYVTENDDLGKLTGSTTTGGTPTMDITVEIKREPTSALCDEEATWHATYTVTTPDTLDVATS